MVVMIAWIVLAAAGLIWEIFCHLSGRRWTSLANIGSTLWSRLPGRLVLVVIWAFVGWHMFARYTLPG